MDQEETPGAAVVALWPRVYGYALALVGEPARAEDLCQEACLRLLLKGGARQPSRSLVPYLFAIVRNLHHTEHRRRRPTSMESGFQKDMEGGDDPVEAAAQKEAAERLWERLGSLPALWREVLYLREGVGLSYREIGDVTGKGEDVIRTTLYRARRRARRIAAGEGGRRQA